MNDLIKEYQRLQLEKSQLEADNNSHLDNVCSFLDRLLETPKNNIKDLDLIKHCSDIEPDFKKWLNDKFYKYEGGNVDLEDLCSLGSSVLFVLGYDVERYELTRARSRLLK